MTLNLMLEDLNIKKKTVDVYRTKNGMVTQRNEENSEAESRYYCIVEMV